MSNEVFILLLVLVFLTVLIFLYQIRIGSKNVEIKRLTRLNESRYRDLANLLPQLVVELDNNGIFTYVNRAGLEILGLSKYELKNSIYLIDHIHPSDRDRFMEEWLYLMEGGLKKGQEFRIVSKEGKILTVYCFLKKIDGQIEKQSGMRGFIIDVTEQKELERKVISSVLETEDRERRRYSEDLHDGLGPLLSTIKLYLNQISIHGNFSIEDRQLLEFMSELLNESIVTTRNLANNMLPGSVIDNGLIPALNSFVQHLKVTGVFIINFESNIKDRMDHFLEINLYRISIELINNTIKYANASEINLTINKNNSIVELDYSDNGVGFEMVEVKRGLGLGNIKSRVESMKGLMQYQSKINQGVAVHIEIELNNRIEI